MEKIRQTLSHLKNLKVLSLVGNTLVNNKDYKATMQKVLPQILILDPQHINVSS